MTKKSPILTQIGRFRAVTPIRITDGYEMMHKAWSNVEEVPIVFKGHASNFKVTPDNKSPILTPIERFRTVPLTDGFEMTHKA